MDIIIANRSAFFYVTIILVLYGLGFLGMVSWHFFREIIQENLAALNVVDGSSFVRSFVRKAIHVFLDTA